MKSKLQSLVVLTLFIFFGSTSFAQSVLMPNLKEISNSGTEFLIVIPASAEKGRPELVIGENFKPLEGAFDPNNPDYPSWKFDEQIINMGDKNVTFYAISCNGKYLFQVGEYESMNMVDSKEYKKIYEKDENGKDKVYFNDFMRFMYHLVPAEDGTVQLYHYNAFSKKTQLLNIKGAYHGTPVKLVLWKK